MTTKLQFRRGTALSWTTSNPILAEGEMGLELDTAKFKIGNGTQSWTLLPYGGIQGPAGTNGTNGDGLSIGDIVYSTRPTPPTGYLQCDGLPISKSTYASLYSVIGDQPADNIFAHTLGTVSGATPAGTILGVNSIFITSTHDGQYVAIACTDFTAKIEVYKRTGSTLTRLPGAISGSGITTIVNGIAFSPDGTYLAVNGYRGATTNSPVAVFKRTGDTFAFLTSLNETVSGNSQLTTQSNNTIEFNSTGEYLAFSIVGGSSVYTSVYRITAPDTFTRLTFTFAASNNFSCWVSPNQFTYYANTNLTHTVSGNTITSSSSFPDNTVYSHKLSSLSSNVYFVKSAIFKPVAVRKAYTSFLNIDTFYGSSSITPISGTNSGFDVSKDGKVIALGTNAPTNGSPSVLLYRDTGSSILDLGGFNVLPVGCSRLCFGGVSGEYLFITSNTAPYVQIYARGYSYDTATQFQLPSIPDQKMGGSVVIKAYIRAQ